MSPFPTKPGGEQAVQLVFVEHYSKCVVRRNSFLITTQGDRYHYSR